LKRIAARQVPLPKPGDLLNYSSSYNDLSLPEIKLPDLNESFSRADSRTDFFSRGYLASMQQSVNSSLRESPEPRSANLSVLSKSLIVKESPDHKEDFRVRPAEYIVRRPKQRLIQALHKSSSTVLRPLRQLNQKQHKQYGPVPVIPPGGLSLKMLSLEYYDGECDDYSPRTLLRKLAAVSKDGVVRAQSKWYLTDGSYKWRKCVVNGYDFEHERYQILWQENQPKLVSRINLRFNGEDAQRFQKRHENAVQWKSKAEILMKYICMIKALDSPTPPLPRVVLEQILRRLQGFAEVRPYRDILAHATLTLGLQFDFSRYLWKNLRSHFLDESDVYRAHGLSSLEAYKEDFYQSLEQLSLGVWGKVYQIAPSRIVQMFLEVEEAFTFTQHQCEFEADLPFNLTKQELFSSALPPEKFVSCNERVRPQARSQSFVKGYQFLRTLQNIELHQKRLDHLEILRRQKANMLTFEADYLFIVHCEPEESLKAFIRSHKRTTQASLRTVMNLIFDTQYEIQDIVNKANAERQARNQQRIHERAYDHANIQLEHSLDPQLVRRLSRLMKLCNHMVEVSVRECLTRSLAVLTKQMLDILQHVADSLDREIQFEQTLNLDDLARVLHYRQLSARNRTRPTITSELRMLDGCYVFDPSPQDYCQKLQGVVQYAFDQIKTVPCIAVTDVGQARPGGYIDVLEPILASTQRQLGQLLQGFEDVSTLVRSFLEVLEPYKFLIDLRPKMLKKALAEDFDLRQVGEELITLEGAKEVIRRLMHADDYIHIGVFKVDISQIKATLLQRIDETFALLIELLDTKAKESITLMEQQEKEILEALDRDPSNLEELDAMRTFIQTSLGERLSFIKTQTDFVFNVQGTFDILLVKSSDIIEKSWKSFGVPKRVLMLREKVEVKIKDNTQVFSEQLSEATRVMLQNIEDLWSEMNSLRHEEDVSKYEEMSSRFVSLKALLDGSHKDAKLITSREGLVGCRQTDFKRLDVLRREFNPYFKLWNFVKDFNSHFPKWMKGTMNSHDRDSISDEVNTYFTELSAMERGPLKHNPAGLKVAQDFKAEVAGFKPYLPIIYSLRNPGLRERHWEELRDRTKISLTKALPMCLEDLLNEGIMEHLDFVEEVSDKASRQLALEQAKIVMEQDWEDVRFNLLPYKDTGTWILVENEVVWELLNEHLLKTFSMCNSPYIKFMEREVLYWRNGLVKVQEILEAWEAFQKSWQYLNPILTQEDIVKQLPAAANRFKQVHELWLVLMERTQANPLVLDACLSHPKMTEQLRQANEVLEQIKKSLDEFLNNKRSAFPRFYFLANDELLAILSKSTELHLVQKYMFKCFEGVSALLINDVPRITGLLSFEGEAVHFRDHVDFLHEETQVPRNVETWLKDVEKTMFKTMRELLEECYQDSMVTPRFEWLQLWPSQLVHSVNLAVWTARTSVAIQDGLLQALWTAEQQSLNSLVEIVRQESKPLARKTMGTAVVLDVHKQDVLESLVLSKVIKPSDFEWQAQLRYYITSSSMFVHMIDSSREYGFEYLGNQDRLVITPLTDRCYRTLMGALKLNLGGAPEGPAGTGKTETTKDLAKSLAKKCVVFNCSDQLDQASMAKFFTGLVSCGAWVCFDEFNRIELEVLSVIAEQIHSIQNAVLKKNRSFEFEESIIPLDPTCAIFITMNPDYAGRSVLPDNLKALFRPVAMMIPDYSMIAEISLYSYGFKAARVLAVKLINSLRLASEQLSSQHHYDYGMRTVTTIIKAAGQLKRLNLDAEESSLILRAINDCNLPKFLADDIELFKGITNDLFPDVESSQNQYGDLLAKILEQVELLHLVPKPEFLTKVLQLHDTLQVRHGLMLVGSAMAGKSTILEVLARATMALHTTPRVLNSHRDSERLHGYRILRRVVNPKSVPMKQLYGDTDPVSKDWIDGVLSHCIREFTEDASDNPKWIVLDGPVDAVWIENLNTVLDDNKKLCLPSGEIVKFTNTMTMLFEVNDLSAASPATVSRCGMIFVNREEVLDWRVVLDHWLMDLPLEYRSHEAYLRGLCCDLLGPCLKAVETVNDVQVKTSAPWLVYCFVNLMESLMLRSKTRMEADQDYKILKEKEEQKKKDPAKTLSSLRFETGRFSTNSDQTVTERNSNKDLFSWAYFAVVWALGGVLPEGNKKAFDVKLRSAVEGSVEIVLSENDGFNVYYNFESQEWLEWKVEETASIGVIDLTRLLVPTVDTVRYSSLLKTLLPKGKHTLIVGPTGTGKSALARRFLAELSTSKFISVSTSLSARASCSQTQDLIESKLVKQMKGVYGPESGKQCVVFVDDLSMPAKEEYGAQPSLEVLRQAVDRKELYERETCELRHIEGLTYMAAMTNRQVVSERLIRHFNMLCISEFSEDVLKHIFNSILSQGFNDYSQPIIDSVVTLTRATLAIYRSTVDLLPPTPMKSHYTFNLRDLSSVFRGLISVPTHRMHSIDVMQRLWLHECLRVFSDRLTTDEDRRIFEEMLEKNLNSFFQVDMRELVGSRPLIFCNFLEEKSYQEVENYDNLKEALEQALFEFNNKAPHPMELVLFDFAIQHIARITRIINSTYGHALLIGVGGSGRQSLSILAAFLLDFVVFQISITKVYSLTDWYEDLRGLLRRAGLEEQKTLFLLKDADIRSEVYLENINNILNSGEVPNLFSKEERDFIINNRSRTMSFKSPAERWDLFVEICRKNLHIIMCMSPIGEKLRVRVRQFPSLVSCCTIDWLTQWPTEALESVARRYLYEHDLVEPEQSALAVRVCVHFHNSVEVCAQRYYLEMRRSYYVTPTHYLQLLQNIKAMRSFKQQTTVGLRDKFQRGVDKLNSTQCYVEQLKREQLALEPVLVQKTKETEDIMKLIIKETAEADVTRSVVAVEQQESAQQAIVAERIKNECKKALETAEPQLKAAVAALKTLKKPELNIVRTMQKPPLAIRLVLEAVAILNRQTPVRVQDLDNRSNFRMDYFEAGKKMMNNPNFIKKLTKFDYNSLDRPLIERITVYIENENFQPEMVRKAAGAAEGLCRWCIALYNYFFVKQDIGPKQAALIQATEELRAKSEQLKLKQEELEHIEQMIADKKAMFEQANAEKQQLFEDIAKCQAKLERAERLTDKLGGERAHWEDQVESLSTDMTNLLGDVMMAAASASYFGPFVSQYREDLAAEWLKFVREESRIPCNAEFSLKTCLTDSLQVQEWTIQGLPSDKVSIENAIILSHSARWPLIIDPQKQASKWLKQSLTTDEVQVIAIKASSETIINVIENALFMGSTLMIENLGEELDPVFEPILLKQIVVKDGLKMIKLGDSLKQYDEHFRLYMFTNLSNPHYTPETTTKVTLLNFTITKEGLTEQLLSIVCNKEMTKETEERRRLTVQTAEYVKRMRAFEDSILEMMEKAGTEMLEDENMINSLTESKHMSEEAERRLIHARKAEVIIIQSQKTFEPVAKDAALLYFAVTDLAAVQEMYQFSLEWFNQLFKRSIETGEYSKELEVRLLELVESFRKLLFKNIYMSLFEKDKLLFSFIVAQRLVISRMSSELAGANDLYRRFLLTGRGAGQEQASIENPAPDIIEAKHWTEASELSSLQGFEGLQEHMVSHMEAWKKCINQVQDFVSDPEFDQLTSSFPSPYNDTTRFNCIQRLLLFRVLKPEDLIPAIKAFVRYVLGPTYSELQVTDFKVALQETDCFQPIVFILSSGNDPQLALKKFGEEEKKALYAVSLGKGQGYKAVRMIKEVAQAGCWVLLQNCHLAQSWLPSLEALVERLKTDHDSGAMEVHPDFRLWLTSMPTPFFPVALLQNSFKVTTEPAKGLKNSMQEIYLFLQSSKDDLQMFRDSTKPQEWNKLFFSLAFFHCLVRERRKFGALGWNVSYEFNDSDFKISMRQLHVMLETNPSPPFKALNYLTGECNYGGRVTDDWDRRTLLAILQTCYNENALVDNYRYCKLQQYYAPTEATEISQYLEFIDKFPSEDSPEVFGLHDNANINYARKEAYELFEKLLTLNPMGSSKSSLDAQKHELIALSTDLLSSLPENFDAAFILAKYPLSYEQSLNVVLQQEAERYNSLLNIVKSSLKRLISAMNGTAPLTHELESLGENLLQNRLPRGWAAVSYPSCKPMLSWVKDLTARVNFLERWIHDGPPAIYWLPGFFFTQSFLTGTRQNYARKHHLPIDQLTFKFTIIPSPPLVPPSEGCYVNGLFLQGARWSSEHCCLDSPLPKELFSSLPTLWIEPVNNQAEEADIYKCPVYKTTTRAGSLSTTGHSTNYLMTVDLPTTVNELHWVRRGVALLTQLDD
jgi:dynein heavy chain